VGKQICICVLGWHFQEQLFQSLATIVDIDIYVLSHQPETKIPPWLHQFVPSERVILGKNIGYDWGGYQQFGAIGIVRDYPYTFFLHDDILVRNPRVFSEAIMIIEEKGSNCVIGNGRQSHKRDWPRTHLHSYAHSSWKPPSREFCHDTLRGSFWGTSCQVLDQILPLEVFWDRRKWQGIGAGNWSLRATCGKIQHMLGDDAFHFLSETYLSSEFIQELERGQETYEKKEPSLSWKIRNRVLVSISSYLMEKYLEAKTDSGKHRVEDVMKTIFRIL
jgi:hypothetical protein